MNTIMVLIIGALMSGMAFSLYMNNSSGQQRTQTLHAVTHAQSGVWLSTNAVNEYIRSADISDLITLYSQQPDSIELTFPDASISGKFVPDYDYPDTDFDSDTQLADQTISP